MLEAYYRTGPSPGQEGRGERSPSHRGPWCPQSPCPADADIHPPACHLQSCCGHRSPRDRATVNSCSTCCFSLESVLPFVPHVQPKVGGWVGWCWASTQLRLGTATYMLPSTLNQWPTCSSRVGASPQPLLAPQWMFSFSHGTKLTRCSCSSWSTDPIHMEVLALQNARQDDHSAQQPGFRGAGTATGADAGMWSGKAT